MNITINRRFIATILVFASLFLLQFFIPNYVSASAGGNAACDTLSQASGKDCATEQSGSAISTAIKGALNLLSIVAGVITVVMVIIGGFKYITSQGDPSSTKSARNTILYALIGIIIVALSQTIVYFVYNRATAPPPPSTKLIQQEKLAINKQLTYY